MAQNPYPRPPYRDEALINITSATLARMVLAGVVVFLIAVVGFAGTYIVQPGTRGIRVTLGKASDRFLPEGFGVKTPFVTTIVPINVRQRTKTLAADCFSSDLQQVNMDLRVLYRVPEQSVVPIYRQYAGDPFDSLIAPRVQEAVKEVTALMTAEQIVKNREEIKQKTIVGARTKIGTILSVEDIVIRNIELSPELERVIEAKMVADQQASQARFTQLQTQIEAETAVIRARGEAEAIRVRGEALKANPAFIRLQIVERWNGKSPLVVPGGQGGPGVGILLPIGESVGIASEGP
jgi:prohibitin 2